MGDYKEVRFGGLRLVALAGILGGVAIAVGVPWVTLVYGQGLWQVVKLVLILLALVAGGGVALTSAFFGIVIPAKVVKGSPGAMPCAPPARSGEPEKPLQTPRS